MSEKLLIIDDDEGDQILVKEAIISAGLDFDILVAESGEKGVKMVKELKSNVLVVLDTLLPGIDGFETCKKIKDICGDKVRIIICTGMIDVVDAGKAREAGADEYTVKTSDCKALLEKIEKYVST